MTQSGHPKNVTLATAIPNADDWAFGTPMSSFAQFYAGRYALMTNAGAAGQGLEL